MGQKIRNAAPVGTGGSIAVMPLPIIAQRAPTTTDTDYPKGQVWLDENASPSVLYTHIGGGTWDQGGNAIATNTVYGLVRIDTDGTLASADDTHVPTALAAKTYIDSVAIAGSPAATETTAGIAEIATTAETVAYTDDARIVTPAKLADAFASPDVIGDTAAAAATFTDLTADGTGTVTLTSNAASVYDVTGAGNDLTLSSDAGRVIVNGEEAAANAITLTSAAGGLDVDVALQMNLASSQNAADAIVINASAGGIDITAAGAAGEDLDLTCTSGSVNITAGENVANSIVISSTNGGIDISAAGAAAGEDIDITATGSSVNITATENVSDSIVISSTNGGIDISATGAVAGEDIDITASSSINLTSTENVANALYLHANGGTSETIKIHSDQGTGVASIEVASDVGGVTISSGLASADAININASDAAGGIDIDCGSNGFIVDAAAGAISLDSALASNFTVTGAADLTLQSTAGSCILSAGESATDAIKIEATAGGIDILASGAAAGEDIDIIATGSSVNIQATEADANAITINASNAAGGINMDAGTGGILCDAASGAISLDAGAASNFNVTGATNDLTLGSAGGRVIVDAGENAADAIYLHANAGISETIRLHADQGTGVASIHLESDVGGITLTSTGLASDDAINLNAAAGGVDIDGALQVNIASSENAADAIVINASAGGIDITAAGAAAEDLDLTCTSGSVNITAGESASDAIVINASDAASGIQLLAGTGGIQLGAGIRLPVTSRATAGGTYTIDADDYMITTDSTGGAFQVNLPAAPNTGETYLIWDGAGQAATGGAITISGNGNNIAVEGTSAATYVMNGAYESVLCMYNGTLWMGRLTT